MSNKLPALKDLTRERFLQREMVDNLWARDVHGWVRFLRTVFSKRSSVVLGVPLLVGAVAAAQLWTTSPWYQSRVTVQVEPGRNAYLPFPAVENPVADFYTTDTHIRTLKEVLESEVLSQRVVQALNLVENPDFQRPPSRGLFLDGLGALRSGLRGLWSTPAPETESGGMSAALKRLREQLDVRQVLGTRLIEIRFNWPDAELAARIANAYSEQFLALDLEARADRVRLARASLEEQLQQVKQQLEEADAALADYGKSRQLLNIDENQRVTLEKLVDLNQQLTQVQADLIAKEANQQLVSRSSVENFPPALSNPKITQLEATVNALEQRQANLLSKYGRNWPEAVQVSSELQAVREQLAGEKQKALQQAGQDYQVAVSRYELLAGLTRQQMQRASQLDEDLIQFRILRREVATNHDLYQDLLERLKETTVASSLSSSDIRVLSPARVPEQPLWPKKLQTLLIALAVGFLFAAGTALAAEALDDTIKTPEQLERALPIVCLGVIPTYQRSQSLETQETMALARTEVNHGVVPVDQGVSRKSWEAYKLLRASLLQNGDGELSRTILVTSTLPNEGATSTAVYSAMSGAQSGFRTILLDLNFRRPALHRFFSIPPQQPGLIDFLSGNGNLVSRLRTTVIPGLFILSAGEPVERAGELIASPLVDQMLKMLRTHFDVIVVDSPPVLEYSDAMVLAPKMDEVVLVVRAGKTPTEAVRRACSRLDRVGIPSPVAVLNSIDSSWPEYRLEYESWLKRSR